jgi:hypothetical protein
MVNNQQQQIISGRHVILPAASTVKQPANNKTHASSSASFIAAEGSFPTGIFSNRNLPNHTIHQRIVLSSRVVVRSCTIVGVADHPGATTAAFQPQPLRRRMVMLVPPLVAVVPFAVNDRVEIHPAHWTAHGATRPKCCFIQASTALYKSSHSRKAGTTIASAASSSTRRLQSSQMGFPLVGVLLLPLLLLLAEDVLGTTPATGFDEWDPIIV